MDKITDVIKEINKQLDFCGPNGKGVGHVVLTRTDAIKLIDGLRDLVTHTDQMLAKALSVISE